VAFFERAEILTGSGDDEILPVEYSDNYVTVFPGETVELHGVVPTDHTVANWVRVGGYNTPPVVVPIE
jgi:exo-1,4-beta-D-glucosaminidase